LPAGVTLTDNGDGTATLAGTSSVSPGVYTFTLQADNGVSPTATQAFTLTVAVPGAPAITSSPTTTVTAGTAMAPFTITTDGFPVPALTRKGPLPAGVTFTDNHNGTATISGNLKANQGGTYVLTLAASNDEGTATQTFTLVVNQTPTVTSHATTTFTAGVAGTFTVTTNGNPAPALTYTSAPPPGVTFVDNGDGTATISGIPAADGSYPMLVTATNAAGSVSQWLTINVDQTAAITSAPGATATAGTAMAPFTVTTSGFPVPSLSKNGPLPSGITFTDNHDGTATISGVPKASQGGPYVITITASNNQGSATQTFTLTVNEAPILTSHSSTTFTAGDYGTFTVTTHGFPAPALTYTGVLPAGLTFVDNGDGTATISGIPTADGSYPIVITATNGFGTVSDSFTVKVS
jgi:Putative Ig domain